MCLKNNVEVKLSM